LILDKSNEASQFVLDLLNDILKAKLDLEPFKAQPKMTWVVKKKPTAM